MLWMNVSVEWQHIVCVYVCDCVAVWNIMERWFIQHQDRLSMRETERCVISNLSGCLHIQLDCIFSGKKKKRSSLGWENRLPHALSFYSTLYGHIAHSELMWKWVVDSVEGKEASLLWQYQHTVCPLSKVIQVRKHEIKTKWENQSAFIIINMQNTEKTVYLTDECLPHTLCYPLTTLYNVRRLLRNYYNYSVCFHLVKSQTDLYKRTQKHSRQPWMSLKWQRYFIL